MSNFEARRILITAEGRIGAPVARVFPLACPFEEYKWIDGWDCNIVYAEHEKVSNGCIFTETRTVPLLHDSEGGVTTWIAVLYDPETHRLHFVLMTDISAIKYEIEMDDAGGDATRIKLSFTLTALNERGNRYIENGGEQKVQMMLAGLGHMLKHYCETGQMLANEGK